MVRVVIYDANSFLCSKSEWQLIENWWRCIPNNKVWAATFFLLSFSHRAHLIHRFVHLFSVIVRSALSINEKVVPIYFVDENFRIFCRLVWPTTSWLCMSMLLLLLTQVEGRRDNPRSRIYRLLLLPISHPRAHTAPHYRFFYGIFQFVGFKASAAENSIRKIKPVALSHYITNTCLWLLLFFSQLSPTSILFLVAIFFFQFTELSAKIKKYRVSLLSPSSSVEDDRKASGSNALGAWSSFHPWQMQWTRRIFVWE